MDLTMSRSSLSLLFLISLHIHFLVPASGYFQPFLDCDPYDCGDQQISYPFRHKERDSHCGYPGYELGCEEDNLTTLSMGSLEYRVIHVNRSAQILVVARKGLSEDICREAYNETTLNLHLFNYTSDDLNSTLFFGCDSWPTPPPYRFFCFESHDNYFAPGVDLSNPPTHPCRSIVHVPILRSFTKPSTGGDDRATISEILNRGFEITWIANTSQCDNCIISEGRCGYDWARKEFNCFCLDGAHSATCNGPLIPEIVPPGISPVEIVPPGISPVEIVPISPVEIVPPGMPPQEIVPPGDINIGRKVGIGLGSAAGGGIAVIMIIYFIYKSRQRKKADQSLFVSRSMSSGYSPRTDFERGSAYYGLPIFDYEELKKATNDFDPAEELGDGGFGTVFKGKLKDGRVVAVKRLYESNYKRVEQFMNEVEILTRLRHPNLVSLYGCTSRQSHRLLLVYEYVPNGTVADHIHGDLAKPGSPPWSTRLNIAIETATALVYLHASDVIHRDVKTNNILLDENFSVKVADFGLSRLFPFDVTHVSTAPQGTPGYVDPEYHQCYQLTEKSDVYSFGVVLMELISSLPAVDITRHRHEINLSALAMSKIQSHTLHELVDRNLGFDTDYRTREMIIAVAELGFQCLQEGHDMRPSMMEVLETLKDIQKCGHNMEKKSGKMDNLSEDAVLLKNNPLTLSPDSVTVKWASLGPTPHASG